MTKARVERVLALVFASLAMVTATWPTWLEALTGLDPDGGGGSTELGIVVALVILAAGAALAARRTVVRARPPL